MKLITLIALTTSILLTNDVQAIRLSHMTMQAGLTVEMPHQDLMAQLQSAAQSKGFWDFLKTASSWIKDTVHKVAKSFGAAAQENSRAYVNELAQKTGATLPKLSMAELTSMGFNKNAFAQMNAESLSQEDLKQVILLGLAAEDINVVQPHQDVMAQLQSAAKSKGFWDFLKKASSWIKDSVHKVAKSFTSSFGAAQKHSRAYVNELAQKTGATLPKLSMAELESMGFNKDAFAQMNVKNLAQEDLRQVILLGLAAEDMNLQGPPGGAGGMGGPPGGAGGMDMASMMAGMGGGAGGPPGGAGGMGGGAGGMDPAAMQKMMEQMKQGGGMGGMPVMGGMGGAPPPPPPHADMMAQLQSAAESKGFWDFLKTASSWIKDTVHKVAKSFGAAAQENSRAYVNELAQKTGVTVPKLSMAELTSMGFNKNAFAQMNVESLSKEDLKQVILLGLAAEDINVQL